MSLLGALRNTIQPVASLLTAPPAASPTTDTANGDQAATGGTPVDAPAAIADFSAPPSTPASIAEADPAPQSAAPAPETQAAAPQPVSEPASSPPAQEAAAQGQAASSASGNVSPQPSDDMDAASAKALASEDAARA